MFICSFGLALIVVAVCVTVNVLIRRRRVDSEGKAVLITGCDRGFGHMLAIQLAKLGYRVFAGCLDATGEGAVKLCKTSSNIEVIQLDVTSDEQVTKARTYVDRQWGNGLWAVVNNAGVAVFAEAEWCSLEQYQTVMNINWLGTVRVTKAFLPLVRATRGRVVNLSSLAGRVALPGFTSYSSSKFAVIGFSDSLRREMVKFGVRVITIEPSLYRTAIANREVLTRQNSHLWAAAPQEVRHDYGDTYFRAYLAKLAEMLRLASKRTWEVLDDLEHAVTAEHPYRRYVPALFTNQLPADCFSVCPNVLQDRVVTHGMRVPATPAALLPSLLCEEEDDEEEEEDREDKGGGGSGCERGRKSL
ncbi:short-chain dehydrogenase/reductase family 9C member 7-like isoform X1 [Babylonia areolata]|uniref:short-chain dehydrogenase/reductase family 9C member 7-like isoform X1 n=2 Tax=Babylonia areolata TaxID=304850 RepID=UPI003FD38920